MSMSNAFEQAQLDRDFQAAADPLVGVTEFDVHLHVANPGESGTSATSPATYTSYAPITVDRNATDWVRTGSIVKNGVQFQFPKCTGGTSTITHVSVTRQGDTAILWYLELDDPLSVALNITPLFPAATLEFEKD